MNTSSPTPSPFLCSYLESAPGRTSKTHRYLYLLFFSEKKNGDHRPSYWAMGIGHGPVLWCDSCCMIVLSSMIYTACMKYIHWAAHANTFRRRLHMRLAKYLPIRDRTFHGTLSQTGLGVGLMYLTRESKCYFKCKLVIAACQLQLYWFIMLKEG